MDGIGNTPLFHIRGDNEILLKLEGHNLFGSIKDRAAAYFIEKGINDGKIKRTTEIVESSSGNFAVALAGVCKIYKLKFTCIIDPLISEINRRILELYGAKIIMVTSSDIAGSYVQERLKTVRAIITEKENVCWPNQYDNPVICEAYKNTIGQEISKLYDIDYVFVAVSTCGTIAGISQAVKEHNPDTKIIAVDIEGSKIFKNDYSIKRINGMGASFRPANLEHAYIDDMMIISTEECIKGCMNLLNYGILAGGSSGAVFAACNKFANEHELRRKRIVGILPDRGERYMDSIYNIDWRNNLDY